MNQSLQRPLHVAVFQSALGGAPAGELISALDSALGDVPGAGLMVCPELFLGGYGVAERTRQAAEAEGGAFMGEVARLAKQHTCAIAYGYAEQDGEVLYNAAAVIGADGSLLAHHRKRRLPNAFEKSCFSAGGRLTFFTLGGWKIAVIICYEVEFPETVRAAALHGAGLAIVPTALSDRWPVVAQAVIPARAFENGMFLGYANHGGSDSGLTFLGQSCIIGPDGQELARAGAASQVIKATLDPGAIAGAREAIAFLADCRGMTALFPPK